MFGSKVAGAVVKNLNTDKVAVSVFPLPPLAEQHRIVDNLDKIFERFYVVDKSRNKNISSTGLGLAIVKHVVKAHDGTVTVNSQLGEGTTFVVTLPIQSK